jgi:hypothetical protein
MTIPNKASVNRRRPSNFNFTATDVGDEDCLFLSVFSPQNAKDLPVMVWIRKCSQRLDSTLILILSRWRRVWNGPGKQ